MTCSVTLDLGEFSFEMICVCEGGKAFLEYSGERRGQRGDLFTLKIGFISEISLLILPSLLTCKCFPIKVKCVILSLSLAM